MEKVEDIKQEIINTEQKRLEKLEEYRKTYSGTEETEEQIVQKEKNKKRQTSSITK